MLLTDAEGRLPATCRAVDGLTTHLGPELRRELRALDVPRMAQA
ncbi:hypothetical protein [Actinomycetospora chibensis]|uniref:Uncharacterized protein n=1 Tax=Actinomycetospora chibensis TaxID=663606 RepID=A0ABV9RSP1_9PSEU|nr:hypothetical protein [Actinomycetospora chibensis]MDD7922204.1 hypothetical protein [Actinomycetospora chibensis]